MPDICFYVPSARLVASVPGSMQDFWQWIDEFSRTYPVKLPSGWDCTWVGPYGWTVQTFIHLHRSGFPCRLTASIPTEGIIIAHSDFLPRHLKPSPTQFVVELKPDRSQQCLYANFVVVQNRRDPVRRGLQRLLIRSAFIDNWPQPGLIPRDGNRGDRFENVCFMGSAEQFIQEVDVLERAIAQLGLRWMMPSRSEWHDFRDVDAVVAVRPPAPTAIDPMVDRSSRTPSSKPATKLYNAWLAGVPAVLSPDSAFQDLKRSDLDFLEAQSVPEIIARLRQLRGDVDLRRSMVANGRTRGRAFAADRIVQAWRDMIQNQIVPQYEAWSRSPVRRRWLYVSRARYFGAGRAQAGGSVTVRA